MADFQSQFQAISEQILSAANIIFSKLDQITFKMTIDQLKNTDYQSVSITLDQLAKEKKPLSLPPIYFISQAHPDLRVRAKAKETLKAMGCESEIEKITANKSVQEAVKGLLEHYGNYRKI